MSDADDFLKTLKLIGFPQVNSYKPADFESLYLDKELKPILESICDLNEDNVLTSEELSEYASLSPAELAYYEKLAEDENLALDESETDKWHEAEHLEEYLALVLEEKESLQKQKQKLKSHENILLEEKEKYKAELIDAKKQFELYTVKMIPQAETKLASTLKSVADVIAELQNLITDSDTDSKIFPPSLFKDIDSYFDDEKEILNHVKRFLQKKLEVSDDDNNFSLKVSGHSQSKLLREVHYLRNVLKTSKNEEFLVLSERVKNDDIIKFFKRYGDEYFSHIFGISSSQLWNKYTEESRINLQLKEKEDILKLRLSNAISEHINSLCSEIGITHSEEISQCYNHGYKKIQAPLEHILSQRSRLELIVLYLNAHKESFENIKYLIESMSSFIKKEETILCNIKNMLEEKEVVPEPKRQKDYLSDSSIWMTIYRILNDIESQELHFVSSEEVLSELRNLFEDQACFKKSQEEKLHHLHLMEEQSADLEKYFLKGKPFSKFLEADADLNVTFNKLDLKMAHFSKITAEIEADINEKEKLLERKENLQLARSLFIDAFLDPEYYREQVLKIKDAYENIFYSSLNQSNALLDCDA